MAVVFISGGIIRDDLQGVYICYYASKEIVDNIFTCILFIDPTAVLILTIAMCVKLRKFRKSGTRYPWDQSLPVILGNLLYLTCEVLMLIATALENEFLDLSIVLYALMIGIWMYDEEVFRARFKTAYCASCLTCKAEKGRDDNTEVTDTLHVTAIWRANLCRAQCI